MADRDKSTDKSTDKDVGTQKRTPVTAPQRETDTSKQGQPLPRPTPREP